MAARRHRRRPALGRAPHAPATRYAHASTCTRQHVHAVPARALMCKSSHARAHATRTPRHPVPPRATPPHAMPRRRRAWAAAWQTASFGDSGVQGIAMANSGKNKMLRAHGLCAHPSPNPSPEEQDPARARLCGASTIPIPSPTRSLHPKSDTGAARTSMTSTTSAPQWPPPVLKTMRRWRRGPPHSPGG